MSSQSYDDRMGLRTPELPDQPALRDWGHWTRKGEYDGECWRPACVNLQARWLNEQDAQYYCPACAETLNETARRFAEREPCALLASSDPAVNDSAANES